MRLSPLSLALLLAAAVPAQIELPAFTSTYTSAGHTRGFYFQTPVPIVIIGLRVPDETGHGRQHVEVIQSATPPAIYPSTSSGGQVFVALDQPSHEIIPCALPFNAGDYVLILGGCGSTSSMRSSYGAGAFASNVHGQPITLYRLLTQTNLASTGGNRPYSGFTSSSSIGRVEVFVAGHTAALDYGAGAGIGTGAVPVLRSTRPVVGTTARLTLEQSYTSNQGGLIAIGSGRTVLPIFQGRLLVLPPIWLGVPLGGPLGTATPLDLPIPNDPTLIGAGPLNFQGFVVAPPALAMTNGIEWWLGR